MVQKRSSAEFRENYFAAVRSLSETGSFSGYFPQLSNIQLVELGEDVALAASFAIVPDPGGIQLIGQAPYILVAVYSIDADYLTDVLKDLPVSDLDFIRTVPTDQNSVPLYSDEDTVVGYLVWQPMSRSMEILVSSTPFLIGCLGVIFAIAIFQLTIMDAVGWHLRSGSDFWKTGIESCEAKNLRWSRHMRISKPTNRNFTGYRLLRNMPLTALS